VSLLILLVGVELGRESAGKILQPSEPLLTPLAAGVLTVSILVKLWMGWFNAELGKRADSAALLLVEHARRAEEIRRGGVVARVAEDLLAARGEKAGNGRVGKADVALARRAAPGVLLHPFHDAQLIRRHRAAQLHAFVFWHGKGRVLGQVV
jgi:hypothetical protein